VAAPRCPQSPAPPQALRRPQTRVFSSCPAAIHLASYPLRGVCFAAFYVCVGDLLSYAPQSRRWLALCTRVSRTWWWTPRTPPGSETSRIGSGDEITGGQLQNAAVSLGLPSRILVLLLLVVTNVTAAQCRLLCPVASLQLGDLGDLPLRIVFS